MVSRLGSRLLNDVRDADGMEGVRGWEEGYVWNPSNRISCPKSSDLGLAFVKVNKGEGGHTAAISIFPVK